MGSDLKPEDISIQRSGNNLVVKIINTEDSMTVNDFFKNFSSYNQIERIQFQDGTIWDLNEIIRRQSVPTAGDDYLVGGPEMTRLMRLQAMILFWG